MDPSSRIDSPSAALAAILDLLAAPRPWDLPATSRQLRKLLKAMQHSLQQNRTSASSDSRLVPCLQSLLHFGWGVEEHEEQLQKSTPSSSSPIKKNNKYIPPAARQQQHQASFLHSHTPSSDSEGASDAENSGGSASADSKLSRVRFLALACLQLLIKSDPKAMHPLWPSLLPDPDTDLSSKAAVLQGSKNGTIASNSNLVILTLAHPLLLDSSARVRHSAAVTLGTLLEGPAQRAYLAVAELGNTAAATTTPQQTQKQALRGFVPLSATLGSSVVGTHEALLRALDSEQDSTVVVAILRALGTVLVGTPYSRLPPQLLPSCIETIRNLLQKAQHAQQHDVSNSNLTSMYPTSVQFSVPLLSGSLACLAAALGVKPPLPSVSEYLSNINGIALAQEIFSCISHYGNFPAVQLEALMALRGLTQQYHGAVLLLWPDILHFASSSVDTAPHSGASGEGSTSNNGASSTSSSSYNQDGGSSGSSPREKVVQQSILLLGDYLRHSSGNTTTTDIASKEEEEVELSDSLSQKIEQKWIDAVEMCIIPVISQQESPLLQAAGFGAIATGLMSLSSFSNNTAKQQPLSAADGIGSGSALLSKEMRADLLSTCSKVLLSSSEGIAGGGPVAGPAAAAAASPVRAAAAKAMASLISAVPLVKEPPALLEALPALLAACQDPVVAVRVQAATALAATADALYLLFLNIETTSEEENEPLLRIAKNTLHALLPAAITAALDCDKVKSSGVQSLGALLTCRLLLISNSTAIATEPGSIQKHTPVLLEAERDAIIACISCENAKGQWSACSAAGTLFEMLKIIKEKNKSSDGDTVVVEEGVQDVVDALQQVATESNNSRSRSLALAALAYTVD